MASITVQDRVAHYREWGSGNTIIIMLHGWPADSTHYQELGPLLAKQGLRIIVPDLPGWGNTPKPPKAWTVSDYRDWVHDFTQALEIKQFTLFGHSFGGRVSIKYTIKYAPDLNNLILCASAGVKPDAYTVKRRVLKTSAKIGKKFFDLPLISKLEEPAKKILYKVAGSTDYLKADGVMKETIINVLDEDLQPLLPQIHHKTLLLWGSDDGATPLSDGKKMHKLIKESELKVFEGARHNLVKNNPELVAKAIMEFVKHS